jgi:hypothetical protein
MTAHVAVNYSVSNRRLIYQGSLPDQRWSGDRWAAILLAKRAVDVTMAIPKIVIGIAQPQPLALEVLVV